MMNILFVIGQISQQDSNAIIVSKLSDELKKQLPACKVFIIGTGISESSLHNDTMNETNVSTFLLNTRWPQSEKLKTILRQTASLGIVSRLRRLIFSPPLFLELLFKQIVNGSQADQYKKQIRHFTSQISIDVVIGVSAPFQAAMGAAKAKRKNELFVFYQMDPYFKHYLQPNSAKALKQEEYVCKKADAVLLTELIIKDYQGTSLEKYLTKSSVLNFPAFSKDSAMITEGAETNPENHAMHLVYIGSLYGDIRSPLFLLRLVDELVHLGMNVHLDVVGPVMSPLGEETEELIRAMRETVTMHGMVNTQEAKLWMRKADILVNIANAVPNQLPSKIFEYFSTGKPIINLFKLENCPTLPYMYKYPYCMNIREAPDIDKYLPDKLRHFVINMQGKRLSKDRVQTLFSEHSPEAVTGKLVGILSSLQKQFRPGEH